MKLVQQKILYFTEGKSDKVYEVDLCESGRDLYIVNFRYGRREANLREGTKTVFPVAYEEALQVFNKLIESKVKKGYSESGVPTELPKEEVTEVVNTARAETILKYLKDDSLGNYTRNWKISRILWRATDLKITAAIPFLNHFIRSEDAFEQYTAIRAVAAFNVNDTNTVSDVLAVFNTKGLEDKVGRIAASFLLKFADAATQQHVITTATQKLPKEIAEHTANVNLFFNALSTYFLKDKEIDAAVLYYVYLYAYQKKEFQEMLYGFIEGLPLKVNTFKSIRYIYRAATVLQDYRFLALVSKRIAISAPGYTSDYLYIDGSWSDVDSEKVKANPSIAFSKKTKDYFSRTTYKEIYNWGTINPEAYIAYATALLCALDDNVDKASTDVQYHYSYESGNYSTEKRYFPKYHDFIALMYVIYGGAARLKRQKNKWYYTEVLETVPREEALPALWNTKPNEVLQILAYSKSDVAVTFALGIIKENPKFLENLSDTIISKLVQHYNPDVLAVVLTVLIEKYKTSKPEETIVLSLLQSKNDKAVDIGLEWLAKYETAYFGTADFITKLLLTNEQRVVSYLKECYATAVKHNAVLSVEQIHLLFETPDAFSLEYLIAVNELIGDTHFGKLFSTIPEAQIKHLANSSVITNKLFAANFSKHNSIPTYELFKDSFDAYINSDNELVRKAGISILAHFPDAFLIENHMRIGSFCFSEHKEVRAAIQPTIERLLPLNAAFKKGLLQQLLQAIIEDETYEGLHESCYNVLVQYYGKELTILTQENTIDLVLSNYDFAQKLGTPLFDKNVDLSTLPIDNLVAIANSPVLEIRNQLQHYFKSNISKINYELEGALRVFNSDWQDVIKWSCAYFEEHITNTNWTVDILLYVCDHTKKEVQAFGRRMITQHFSDDKGVSLLVKLQEHPTKDMQFFVTNYLDNYAKDNEAVILKLESYFKSILFNINTHRATKTRVYGFLKQEAIKSKKIALMVVRLIRAVLGTKTMLDNSNNIDVLLAIMEAHPEIDIPMSVTSFEDSPQ